MFVTAYYSIYPTNESRTNYYFELFKELGNSGLPFIIFTDPEYVSMLSEFPLARVIPLNLYDCELYQIAMSYQGELPNGRNYIKDTKEFFGLMNTKIEFMKRACEYTTEQLIWIDFGILKIISDIPHFINKLTHIQSHIFDKITIPGCWSKKYSFSVEHINWRFCGGILIMPQKHIERFYIHSRNVLRDFCTMPIYKLTWETNVWALIETCAEQENIDWYLADHNDSIVLEL